MKDVIVVDQVSKAYRKKGFIRTFRKEVLNRCSFSLREGEVYGLLGLNGSGKTTTLKLLLGFLKPDKGSLFLWGERVPSLKVRHRIGYLPELPFLVASLTGRELLSFFYDLSALPRSEKKKHLEKIIRFAGIENIADRLIQEFSKGMKQRLVLAQALLHDPDLFILDEPTSGLDAKTAKEMAVLILSLKRDGKTVLLSSHQIPFVERVCDRVGILSEGRITTSWVKQEWQKQGGLELLFLREVRQSGEVGSLQIEVY